MAVVAITSFSFVTSCPEIKYTARLHARFYRFTVDIDITLRYILIVCFLEILTSETLSVSFLAPTYKI